MGLTDEYERETGEGGVGGEEGRSAFGGMMRRGRGMVYYVDLQRRREIALLSAGGRCVNARGEGTLVRA